MDTNTLLVPDADDASSWSRVSGRTRTSILAQAEEVIARSIPYVGLEHFREFTRSGDRVQFRLPYFARRHSIFVLAIAHTLQPDDRVLDRLADYVWAVCDEGCWVHAAHVFSCSRHGDRVPASRPIDQGVDLFAAETGTQLTVARLTAGGALARRHPAVSERLDHELVRRIVRPYLDRSDYWWMGLAEHGGVEPVRFNNWNPWINSNALFCALGAPIDDATRRAMAEKAARSVAGYLDAQPADGACDEGPGYWGHAAASAFDCYRLLGHFGEGLLPDSVRNMLDRERIVRMGEYITHCYAGNGEQLMFSDAGPMLDHDPVLMADYAEFAGSELMHDLALIQRDRMRETAADAPIAPWGGGFRAIRHMMRVAALDGEIDQHGLSRDERERLLHRLRVVYPDTQLAVARSVTPHCLFAATGGHNARSHNHNDLGSFVYRVGAHTVVAELGRAHYSGTNFGPHRYTVPQNRSAYHSVPLINGAEQAPGREFEAALKEAIQDDEQTRLVFDLRRAYPPDAATGLAFTRTFTFSPRTGSLDVSDEVLATEPLEVDWTLILAAPPEIVEADESTVRLLLGGLLRAPNGERSLEKQVAGLTLTAASGVFADHAVEEIPGDQELAETWGDGARRFRVLARGNPVEITARIEPALQAMRVRTPRAPIAGDGSRSS